MLSVKLLQNIQTPCYIINSEKLQDNWNDIYYNFKEKWDGNIILGHSVKTNHFSYLLKWAKKKEMLAEVVSDDEYNYALAQGFEEENIIYNGPQKSEKMLILALRRKSIVNIDNLDEVAILEKHSGEIDKDVNLGLRINFDLELCCEGETTAGNAGSRFGLCVENGDFEEAVNRLHKVGFKIKGLHLHYSTKSRSLGVFETLACKTCEISKKYNIVDEINYIDVGGGFFGGRVLKGKPTMSEYSTVITQVLKGVFSSKKVTLILEPGASLVSTAIDYYCKVKNARNIREKYVATVDGSILHVNPFMQERTPEFEISCNSNHVVPELVVGGATCMENDRLFAIKDGKKLEKEDYIMIKNAGAYTLAFNSCFINLPPYVYLDKAGELIELRNRDDIKMSQI